ncbi:Smr/MutS family protein [Mesomycoplasma moatsii]|uniref:Smr/MutS family protein n=1 Tax=Mesomycoplasma moatsii TaxID=171287 RepID=UPI0003B6C02A
MTIDLHGLTVEEATREILVSLLNLDTSYDYELIIITGKGTGTLMMATLKILDEEGRVYHKEDGRVIVFKKEKTDEWNLTSLMNEIKNEE